MVRKKKEAVEERPASAWRFEISIFKDYWGETPEMEAKCFEFDWKCVQLPKFQTSFLNEVKEESRKMYPFLRKVYRRLAATNIKSDLFGIEWNEIRTFVVTDLKILDKKLKTDEIDRLFIAVNAVMADEQDSNTNNPETNKSKALIRYEFLEFMVRLAIKKYVEYGPLESEAEAIKSLHA